MNDDPEYREDPREVGYPPAAEQPIDVDAYEAAGVARVEKAQELDCCEDGCVCYFPSASYDLDYGDDEYDDNGCEHCPNCCGCTPCMYASVA